MKDEIDLHAAGISQSPDVASWAKTLRITDIACTPAGGFVITFDRPIPDSWKWPSAPPPSTDNFQWTVWIFLNIGGIWQGAGFVQMWQGRAQGDRSLPPLFADVDGAPGWTRWWGDVRRLWPTMVDHVPIPGESIGILVSAGNGRDTRDVTSVAERSNVVLFPVRASDDGHMVYLDDAPPVDPPVTVPPVVVPPVPSQPPATDALSARLDEMEAQNEARYHLLSMQLANLLPPIYEGTVSVPYLGTGHVVLTPKVP